MRNISLKIMRRSRRSPPASRNKYKNALDLDTHEPATRDLDTHPSKTRDPVTHDPNSHDSETHDPATRDPKTCDPKEAGVREA